ncbi:hypothetical protein JCM17380_53550 [Desulfosporosinus burensis]
MSFYVAYVLAGFIVQIIMDMRWQADNDIECRTPFKLKVNTSNISNLQILSNIAILKP